MEALDSVIFFNLEKVIKAYRQFAQKNCHDAGIGITIDQWLVLKTIQENPGILQHQLARKVFKDAASVTRIIDLLVWMGLLQRKEHKEDRRRFTLTITRKGLDILYQVLPISLNNRERALEGVSKAELENVQQVLNKILTNVTAKAPAVK